MSSSVKLQTPFIVAVFVLFIGVFASGYFDIYNYIGYFDKIMHFVGGLVIAWIGYAFFYKDFARISKFKQLIILVSFTAMIGVFWEFAEYLSGAYLGDATSPILSTIYRYFHGGGLRDSLLDLGFDMLGAFLFYLYIRDRN